MEAVKVVFAVTAAILLMLATGAVFLKRQVKEYVYFVALPTIGIIAGLAFAASNQATDYTEYCFSIFIFTSIGLWIGQILVASKSQK
jgi:hypothetical protein